MARKALLSMTQCQKARTLYEGGARAVELAQQFGVSESSMYKVLDGSYQARSEQAAPTQERRHKFERRRQPLPVVDVEKPMGITPSLFATTAASLDQDVHPALQLMREKAQLINNIELDDLTVAAAELVVAKARLERILAHVH